MNGSLIGLWMFTRIKEAGITAKVYINYKTQKKITVMVTKLIFKEKPQRIECSDEDGIFAIVYEGGKIDYQKLLLEHSTRYFDVQGVSENFTLFAANIKNDQK